MCETGATILDCEVTAGWTVVERALLARGALVTILRSIVDVDIMNEEDMIDCVDHIWML